MKKVFLSALMLTGFVAMAQQPAKEAQTAPKAEKAATTTAPAKPAEAPDAAATTATPAEAAAKKEPAAATAQPAAEPKKVATAKPADPANKS
jgi:hypothetical protein